MKNLETAIIIQASPQRIWDILLDFKAYPNWNPFIIQISGNPKEKEYLQTSIQLPGQKLQHFEPIVKVAQARKEFRWLGKLFVSGLFDGEHYFKLETISETETRFIHGEQFRGLLVRPIMALIGEQTQQGFDLMNQALKKRAEGHSA